MNTISRLTVLLGAPALFMAAVSIAAWLALGSSQQDFGPMKLAPLPPPSASISPDGVDSPPPPNQLEHMSAVEAEFKNALLPFSHSGLGSAAAYQPNADLATSALECMTQAVYYEAARESDAGQRAVAQVVLNRVASTPFPKTVCGVVQQGSGRPGCQFTFECDGSLSRAPAAALWLRAREVARSALNGYVEPAVGGATHYHADYVFPTWAPQMAKLTKIGHHIFYRWRGAVPAPVTTNPITEPLAPTSPSALEDAVSAPSAAVEAQPAASPSPASVSETALQTTPAPTTPQPEVPTRLEGDANPSLAAPGSATRTRRAMPERPLVANPF